jgi:hypothetical protein
LANAATGSLKNITPKRIHDLLDTIARDGLTTAVLDADTVPDEGDPPGA